MVEKEDFSSLQGNKIFNFLSKMKIEDCLSFPKSFIPNIRVSKLSDL